MIASDCRKGKEQGGSTVIWKQYYACIFSHQFCGVGVGE